MSLPLELVKLTRCFEQPGALINKEKYKHDSDFIMWMVVMQDEGSHHLALMKIKKNYSSAMLIPLLIPSSGHVHIQNYSVFVADYVKAVSMSGKMKSSKRQAAELHFDFPVESLGKLSRSCYSVF